MSVCLLKGPQVNAAAAAAAADNNQWLNTAGTQAMTVRRHLQHSTTTFIYCD